MYLCFKRGGVHFQGFMLLKAKYMFITTWIIAADVISRNQLLFCVWWCYIEVQSFLKANILSCKYALTVIGVRGCFYTVELQTVFVLCWFYLQHSVPNMHPCFLCWSFFRHSGNENTLKHRKQINLWLAWNKICYEKRKSTSLHYVYFFNSPTEECMVLIVCL